MKLLSIIIPVYNVEAFNYCRDCLDIRVVILTGAGDKAFCAGGDMHVKGRGGYVGNDGVPRLNVLDVQMQIRRLPKPVIAMVNGYAIGGGHQGNAELQRQIRCCGSSLGRNEDTD